MNRHQQVYRLLGRTGLEPNLAKTQVISPRARKVVLGLLADQTSPRLTRDFKMKMRMHLAAHYSDFGTSYKHTMDDDSGPQMKGPRSR